MLRRGENTETADQMKCSQGTQIRIPPDGRRVCYAEDFLCGQREPATIGPPIHFKALVSFECVGGDVLVSELSFQLSRGQGFSKQEENLPLRGGGASQSAPFKATSTQLGCGSPLGVH